MKALIQNGYIIAVGEHVSGEEISAELYEDILAALQDCPHEAGYVYRLREDLTWDASSSEPPVTDPAPIEDKAEAYDILTGVSE